MPGTVLSSSLDGTSVLPPDVAASQDTAGAPQNETAIAADPNNSQRIVAGLNDYVTATWTCTIGTSPCSAFGDGYRSEEHTSELQSHSDLVCRLLLEKKN